MGILWGGKVNINLRNSILGARVALNAGSCGVVCVTAI